MKCDDYLVKILKNFAIHGDRMRYDRDLEMMRYNCEDYEDYLKRLRENEDYGTLE